MVGHGFDIDSTWIRKREDLEHFVWLGTMWTRCWLQVIFLHVMLLALKWHNSWLLDWGFRCVNSMVLVFEDAQGEV